MEFCCEKMQDADSKGIVDYAPGALVTIDSNDWAYPINMCPWCGQEFDNPSLDRINKAAEELRTSNFQSASEEGGNR